MAIHDDRGRYRKQRCADYCGALRQTRHPDARKIRSQQRSHRRADRDPDAADDLGDKEETQGTALNCGGFQMGYGLWAIGYWLLGGSRIFLRKFSGHWRGAMSGPGVANSNSQ